MRGWRDTEIEYAQTQTDESDVDGWAAAIERYRAAVKGEGWPTGDDPRLVLIYLHHGRVEVWVEGEAAQIWTHDADLGLVAVSAVTNWREAQLFILETWDFHDLPAAPDPSEFITDHNDPAEEVEETEEERQRWEATMIIANAVKKRPRQIGLPGMYYNFQPPFPMELAPEPEDYIGWFVNQHGEPMVYVGKEDGTAYLVHGDSLAVPGNPYKIVDGAPEGLVINKPEKHFIKACWAAHQYGCGL